MRSLEHRLFQELWHKQIKSKCPYISLCECLEMYVHLLCVLESVCCKLLYDFGFMCKSVLVYVRITLRLVDVPLTQRRLPLHVCLCLFSEFDCYTLRRCVYKSLQGHTVITLFGECFLHHDYTCSDNKSSSYS